MNHHVKRRLARLEARRLNRVADESALKRFEFKTAVMSIVAFHAGELARAPSFATALAGALHITDGELKSALRPGNHDRLDLWALVLKKLNDLAAARGGHPIVENGSLILEKSREDDHRRNGLEMLDQLYDEIPDALKERHHLLPHLADYLL
jgi:hypothetical protein